MQADYDMLRDQLDEYQHELRQLNSYINELNTMTAKHGTPTEQVAEELAEAEFNIDFYEGEIASLKQQLHKPALRLPQYREEIIGAVVLSSISFVAGMLLGSILGRKR